MGVASGAAEGGSDVGDAGAFQDADGEVAPRGHRPGRVSGPQLGGVLGEGGVAKVVRGLNAPVVADQPGEPGGERLLGGQAGDGLDVLFGEVGDAAGGCLAVDAGVGSVVV
ncbi:hypothetical protein, partial [Streptomyces cinnamoneus]|uniref:hypothetical protein n=1 Tax=Streptomyces cinnamoneus TaxID=53446 RepID=UPI001E4598F7